MLSTHVPDLEALELLVSVAAEGSLGRAAAVRGISQPAVSARVQRMERLVGVALVRRSPRGSALTPAGALLVEWARAVLAAAEVLDAGITTLRASRDASLRVAASLTVAEHLLPRWLVQLAAARPETAVSLQAVNSTEVGRAILAGEADLGFVEGPRVERGLSSRAVAKDRLLLVVPPQHPWSRRPSISARDLATTRLVHREAASGTRAALVAALGEAHPLAPPVLELSTSSGVRAAVLAGAGPAVLSRLVVEEDLLAGRLVEVALEDITLVRTLRAVWRKGVLSAGPARDLVGIATRSSTRR